jgi:hypothetical protein
VHAFTAANYGGDLETKKSSTGDIFMAFEGPIATITQTAYIPE